MQDAEGLWIIMLILLVILLVIAAIPIIGVVAGYRAGRDSGRTATILWAVSATIQGVATIIMAISRWPLFGIGILTFAGTIAAHRWGRANRSPTRLLPSREEDGV